MKGEKIQNELLKEDPFTDILGQIEVKNNLKSALITDRHVLIVGPPGVGKTTLAKNVSRIVGGEDNFVRIQGSPDLTAEDLLGDIDPIKALKFGPSSMEAFTKGKIFKANNGVLFFDELNRCPEKLQNALLQVLQERTATIGSYDVNIEADFIFIATMNPEDTNTERLSDVLLDRFDVIYMSYPDSHEIEKQIVMSKANKMDIEFPEELVDYLVAFTRFLRSSEKLEKHPSVRATIGLYERAQSNAFIKGKKKVELEDLQEIVISVLAHRIKLKPSIQYLKSPEEFLKEEVKGFNYRPGKESKPTAPNGGSL